ncbi:MAG: transcriptional regulator, Crp/Fnr family [Thermomicrobiales bacterium]|nr:transcriptional regulator, Crp/Fnr family [Thermomicrobiales bacterium]MDF3038230.1 transcriptional regulator, Crp/Fnr family [Thermomicrobiales bacterium]
MAGVDNPADLGKLELFRGLSASELARVNDLVGRTKFATGATIMTATQPGEIAYIVLDGTLKVSTLEASGRELTLALLGPGEIVGELALADRSGRSADVTSLEPATLVWIDRGSFEGLRRDIPAITENLLRLLARRLRLANAQLQAMATLDVHGRVARQLLALADALGEELPDGGVRIPLRITQSDLAALVGATRVRVNEVIVGFTRRKLIDVDAKHRITVRDRGALEAYVG